MTYHNADEEGNTSIPCVKFHDWHVTPEDISVSFKNNNLEFSEKAKAEMS